jgi:hypothetical protein
MVNSHKLTVEFDGPQAGWLTVKLDAEDQGYEFWPSHVPYDSISELVNALLNILDNRKNAVVHWNDEPVEHLLHGAIPEEVFCFNGTLYEVIRPFWKALRDMETRQSYAEYEKQWREPFPEHEMDDLTKRMNAFRNDT